MLPSVYLDANTWQKLPGGSFFARYAGDEAIYPSDMTPSQIFRPVADVPTEVFIRTSEREKRLEFQLEAKELASGAWGKLLDVSGAGSQVGLVFLVSPCFIGAHILPDIVHLLGNDESIAYDAVIRDIHTSKTIRMFSIGPVASDVMPEEIVLTTKLRWFRNRNNPKHLGFSKEEK